MKSITDKDNSPKDARINKIITQLKNNHIKNFDSAVDFMNLYSELYSYGRNYVETIMRSNDSIERSKADLYDRQYNPYCLIPSRAFIDTVGDLKYYLKIALNKHDTKLLIYGFLHEFTNEQDYFFIENIETIISPYTEDSMHIRESYQDMYDISI